MTRINLIPPSELHRKHLQAEYYELPDIFRLVLNRQRKGYTPATCNIPPAYTFGTGHQTFFFDKLYFLTTRHRALVDEMRARGYTAHRLSKDSTLMPHWWNDWSPPQSAIDLSRARIHERAKALG